MSNPTIKNLRRQIEDTRPKPGSMVAGFPKATVVIAELEMLIARHDALQLRVTSLEAAVMGFLRYFQSGNPIPVERATIMANSEAVRFAESILPPSGPRRRK